MRYLMTKPMNSIIVDALNQPTVGKAKEDQTWRVSIWRR